MGILSKVLSFPVSLPAAGIKGAFLKIYQTAEAQYYSAEAVRSQLVEVGERFDRGEITEDEFEDLEEALLDRLDEIAAYERAKSEGA